MLRPTPDQTKREGRKTERLRCDTMRCDAMRCDARVEECGFLGTKEGWIGERVDECIS